MADDHQKNSQIDKSTKVLIVDDYPVVTDFLECVLIHQGFEIIKASGGEEAVKKAFQDQPDVIILDLAMPYVSGYEVAERLKNDEKTSSIPIIVLTATDVSPDQRAQLEKDVVAIVQKKQFLVENLVAEIGRIVKK
jgi:CheY-like chemotaxis protein